MAKRYGHYSQVLKDEINKRDKIIADKNAKIDRFSKFLNSSKFNSGDELDRYINTSDVQDWLELIKGVGCE
ncbi:MAG: hypothetical protein HF975_04360 [ANME-2 cluster archaeon]|nr:hypothetical protein [ANME-2 cluster archaeon]